MNQIALCESCPDKLADVMDVSQIFRCDVATNLVVKLHDSNRKRVAKLNFVLKRAEDHVTKFFFIQKVVNLAAERIMLSQATVYNLKSRFT
jgi:hypothetical protein